MAGGRAGWLAVDWQQQSWLLRLNCISVAYLEHGTLHHPPPELILAAHCLRLAAAPAHQRQDEHCTMRFGSTAIVLLKCKLEYYRISECTGHIGTMPMHVDYMLSRNGYEVQTQAAYDLLMQAQCFLSKKTILAFRKEDLPDTCRLGTPLFASVNGDLGSASGRVKTDLLSGTGR